MANFLRLAYMNQLTTLLATNLVNPLSSASVVQILVQTSGTKHFLEFA